MAKRITFDEFDHLLSARLITPDLLAEYVELDELSAVPRLVFRRDALTDSPPQDYDLDEQVYLYKRALAGAEHELRDTLEITPRIRVVGEGDSWFNLPPIVRPPAIVDQLSSDHRFRVENIAKWGHTLQRILADGKFLEGVDERTSWYMLSAGGNDLQESLAAGEAIYEYDPERPYDEYLTAEGKGVLGGIHDGYIELIGKVRAEFPLLPVLTFGYDYPRPQVRRGKYIGRHLKRKGIPDEHMDAVIRPIINELNVAISSAVAELSSATYIDCRRVTSPYTWFDDMHPGEDGFGALAAQFVEVMTTV